VHPPPPGRGRPDQGRPAQELAPADHVHTGIFLRGDRAEQGTGRGPGEAGAGQGRSRYGNRWASPWLRLPVTIARVSTKDDLAASEADSWRSLSASFDAIPAGMRDQPLLPNGWSVKDVEWHIVFWWQDCVRSLEALVRGDHSDYQGDTDAINDEALREGRSLTLDEVEERLATTRDRLLLAWFESPEDPRAIEAFTGETIEHYEEHVDDVAAAAARFADGSS
jgi:hypothetical protein